MPLLVVLLATFSLVALAVSAALLPVPSPVQCTSTGCTVDNYLGSWGRTTPCLASQALFPTSEAELFHAVAFASKTSSKIKLVSKGSHSFPKLVCPGGAHGILVSTQFYNSLIHVNASSLTVTAHAGVMLRPLLEKIAEYGLTLPHVPFWDGLSVAGMISTGAHGSSMWGKGSAPHDYVVGMRLIIPASEEEGYAKVVDLEEGDEDLKAAKLSLGVLGAISHVTFQLQPMFKRSVKVVVGGDEHIEDDVMEFARQHEFGRVKWYPGSQKAIYRMEDRVSANTVGNGVYKLSVTDKLEVATIEGLKNNLEAIGKTHNMDKLCKDEEENAVNRFVNSGDGLTNDGSTFTGYPVVGFNHKMQASGGCEEEDAQPMVTPTHIEFNPPPHDGKLMTCLWHAIHGLSFFDTSIFIPISKFRDAILEIKKLRDLHPKAICNLAYTGGGIQIRFLTSSDAYLGVPTDSVAFEILYYRSRDPFTSWMHQDLYEEVEQMLVDKFGGKPHWGKNRNLVFEHMHTRFLAIEKFLEVRQRFDPSGHFSSDWTDAILGIKRSSSQGVQVFQDHCGLEGLCVCKVDSHCHPTNGYFCRAGYVYKEARVCRYEKQDSSF